MINRRTLPIIIGSLCAGSVFFLLVYIGTSRTPGSEVTLPDELAGYSYLTGDVSTAPPGRAIALYQQGDDVDMFDLPQAIVLAADDDAYRRLDAAEARSGPEDRGDPGPMLLSPGGRFVALGDHDTTSPELEVVSLETGDTSRYELPAARSMVPRAWAADAGVLAYTANSEPTEAGSDFSASGVLHLLDLETGNVEEVPGGTDASFTAFSPDGTRLAIQRRGSAGPEIAIRDLQTGDTQSLSGIGMLAGMNAWAPDGQHLAVIRDMEIWVINVATPDSGATRVSLPEHDHPHIVLGWLSNREIIVLDPTQPERTRLIGVSLEDGQIRKLTHVDGIDNYPVSRFQLATALLPELELREAGRADRGPLPNAISAFFALLCGLVTGHLAMRILQRRNRDAS